MKIIWKKKYTLYIYTHTLLYNMKRKKYLCLNEENALLCIIIKHNSQFGNLHFAVDTINLNEMQLEERLCNNKQIVHINDTERRINIKITIPYHIQ